jgi:uncharacterized protein YjiS (DUF1127 family)
MDKTLATKIGTNPAGALIGQTFTAVLRGIRQVITAIKHRRQLADLADAEDHRLRDMGITQDDLHAALSEPLWRDPTAALACRARKLGRPRGPRAESR